MAEQNESRTPGRLSLVSVGIGDPDNITVKALKTIEEASVIFGMKFVLKQCKDYLDGKEVHDAGHGRFTGLAPKKGPPPATPEEEQETVSIIRTAIAEGKNVAVLDFGDPTVYSPQAGYLREFADLSPEVIPGISSVNAGNAALRKELTGDFSRPIVMTHAMEDDETDERLEKLVSSGATMVFFSMGMDLATLVTRLKGLLPGSTPAIIVSQAGFKKREKTITATLETVVEKVADVSLSWAHLLYVGEALQ